MTACLDKGGRGLPGTSCNGTACRYCAHTLAKPYELDDIGPTLEPRIVATVLRAHEWAEKVANLEAKLKLARDERDGQVR